jgi:hypothetical protein
MPKLGRRVNGKIVSAEDRLYDALLAVLYKATAAVEFSCCGQLRLGRTLERREGGKRVDRLIGLAHEYLGCQRSDGTAEYYERLAADGIAKPDEKIDADIPF